jgi:hypothetical protein
MSNTSHEPYLLPARRSWPLAIAGFGAVAVLAACGSGAAGTTAGSTSPSSAASAAPAATPSVSCAHVTALGAALANLGDISVNANIETSSQASADLTTIETTLVALKGEIRSAFSAEADQVRADLTAITKRARVLAAHPSPANLRATTTAVRDLKTAVGSAIAIIRAACPSS